ncbi:MAG: glycosyltransferase family 4 protein [Anaerolineae bacterium]|nr:glycosyltransferase family 4 protein [Anaerolineae bacterium]
MHICYLLLSPTFGMHQYTADYANRMVQAGHKVTLVTTEYYPGHRYLPSVSVSKPVALKDTGFSPNGLRVWIARRAINAVLEQKPDVVHVTGPHLWNILVMRALRKASIPTIHTLHDLDPHPGSAYGPLLYLWNRAVLRNATHILVHGQCYRQRLLEHGMASDNVTYTPLLHLFLSGTWMEQPDRLVDGMAYDPYVLFFGRIESYKGVADLIAAWVRLPEVLRTQARLVLAGLGQLEMVWKEPLPAGIEVRNHLIRDEEALTLFQRCALLVLPYIGATQSALIPAAYFFRKAVLITSSGALPEYVEPGVTGWIVEPKHPASLARALTEALSDFDALERMGCAGRRWYDEHRKSESATVQQMYARLVGREVQAQPDSQSRHI